MKNPYFSALFLENFRFNHEYDFVYFLHFKFPKSDTVNIMKFNEARKVDEDLFLIQYFEYDNMPNFITNIKGHQMHVRKNNLVKITMRKKCEGYFPSYIIN